MSGYSTPTPVNAPGNGPPPLLGPNSWLWRQRTSWPAFVISAVVHLVLLVLAALIVVGRAQGDGHGAGFSGPVEMAVISESELAQINGQAVEASLPSVPDAPLREEDLINPGDAPPGDGESGEIGKISDLGPLAGGGELSAGGGLNLGGAGGGGTSFFGVEASGNRFAFLVDVSSSMEGPRLAILQEELNKSISRMDNGSEFLIVAFATDKTVVGDRAEWREASEGGKRWAKAQIGLLAANGSTEPLPGFKVVLSLRPRPDAIYFMTDGEFRPDVVEDVAQMNARSRIPVHCICFGARDGEAAMKKIAEQSRGSYKFVPQ